MAGQPEPARGVAHSQYCRSWRFKRTREWLAGALTRPAIAPVLVAILALAGTFIAHKQADVRERRHNALMREHYIESVDPVAMAARIAGIRP